MTLGWIGFATWSSFDSWDALGVRLKGFFSSLWVVGLALCVSLGGVLLARRLGDAACAAQPDSVCANLLGLCDLVVLSAVFVAGFCAAPPAAIDGRQACGGIGDGGVVCTRTSAESAADGDDTGLGRGGVSGFSALSQPLYAGDGACDSWRLRCDYGAGYGAAQLRVGLGYLRVSAAWGTSSQPDGP